MSLILLFIVNGMLLLGVLFTYLHLLRTVKGESLTYLQANQLVCHKFMDAGTRQETPGSETQDVYFPGCMKQYEFLCVSSPFPASPKGAELRAQADTVNERSLCHS